MQLNPGKSFKIDGEDTLFYICLTHEDDSAFTDDSIFDATKDATLQIVQNGAEDDTSNGEDNFWAIFLKLFQRWAG